MQIIKSIGFSWVLAALAVSSVALAGPEVQVVSKNNGAAQAIYNAVGSSAINGEMNVSPPSLDQAEAESPDGYSIRRRIAPDACGFLYHLNGASVQRVADVNASPKPDNDVNPRESNTYRVQGNISPDVNHATVHYAVGSKRCKFTTSYLKSRVRGVVLPKWNKSAIGSGGARCEAKITSVNPATHAWVVEFTMR